jgi:CheY-specific phosphatase CheX
MSDPIKQRLHRVAEEILEKLAFMFSFPEDDRDETDYESALAASVSFTGPFSGALVMVVSDQILPELTGNMLGIDDDEGTSLEQRHDALKELINVICGNLLPAIAGKHSIFHVNAPTILPEGTKITNDDKPVSVARLSIEDEPCDILLFVKDGLSPDMIVAESEAE